MNKEYTYRKYDIDRELNHLRMNDRFVKIAVFHYMSFTYLAFHLQF